MGQIASDPVASGIEYSSSSLARSPLARFRRYRARRVPYFSRPRGPHDWHWVVAGIGKVLIIVGLLLFAFVGYQLWGTGIQTAQAQNRLEDQFQEKLAATTTTTAPAVVVDTTIPTAPPAPPVPDGEAIAILRIPRIGIDWQVVEGVTADDLKDGPGHFRDSVMPGQLGNSAIAGHRTTYGHPFLDLDKLQPGDHIEVITLTGTYTYAVTESLIVKPSDYALVVGTVDPTTATLTLATCDPAYTARNRLVVRATLVPEQSGQVFVPPPSTTPPPTTEVNAGTTAEPPEPDDAELAGDAFTEGWFSDPAAIPHVVTWGLVLLAVALGAYRVAKAANRLYVAFLVGTVPFVIVLYFFFENVSRLTPPGL